MVDVSFENLPQEPRREHAGSSTNGTGVLHSVFHTLAYADVFDYPLTVTEVYRYLTSVEASFEDISLALSDETLFSRIDGYYTLRGREGIVETRQRRADVADRLWYKAARYGQIIASLPFVRMVAVTGSLAMNNVEEGKDIDFMLVTAPQHLWTCRAFALFVARLAKLDGVDLCPNYLITTNALALDEHSLYVAHELAQMIPLSGREIYVEMRRLNGWMADYLPHSLMVPELPPGIKPVQNPARIQQVLELLLRFSFLHWFEKWEMNRKIKRLSREQSSSIESYFSADVCKGHINRHGESVVTALAGRMENATKVATTN
jgi:hypothetical protein